MSLVQWVNVGLSLVGRVLIKKEEVKEVNFGSMRKPSNVMFFEYNGKEQS